MRPLALLAPLLLAAAPTGEVLRSIDLAAPFSARSPWRFTATQGPPVTDPIGMAATDTVPGPIRLCLSRDNGRSCVPALLDLLRPSDDPNSIFAEPHYLHTATVVRPRPDRPLLLVRVASLPGGNGNQAVVTALFGYDRGSDRFTPVFRHLTGRNNNEEDRYVASGPLRGAVIGAEPTRDAPFGYWLTVSRLAAGGGYRPVLRYRSATRYGDGNALAAIDSEMPAIQRRLRLWRPGQPLPLPVRGCPRPRLVRGALWCA